MQDPRMPMPEDALNPRRKKKPSVQTAPTLVQPPSSVRTGKDQRSLKKEVSPLFLQPERSSSDSLPDSSTSGNDYRALRHKYLLLEEETFELGRELREVEDDVKTLEDEKLELLDQLVVLEGLIDPPGFQSHSQSTP